MALGRGRMGDRSASREEKKKASGSHLAGGGEFREVELRTKLQCQVCVNTKTVRHGAYATAKYLCHRMVVDQKLWIQSEVGFVMGARGPPVPYHYTQVSDEVVATYQALICTSPY